MARIGIIDLGSNSIRLVIFEVSENTTSFQVKRDIISIIDEKKVAGLSAYVQDGIFTEMGIKRASEVLLEHLQRIRKFECTCVRIFATAVLRNCLNTKEAVRAIGDEIGQTIEVLSAADEAHLGFVGASSARAIEQGTLVDIGGGSTELTAVLDSADVSSTSIPQGSVSSYAQFVASILPTRKEIRAIETAFRKQLASCADIEAYRAKRLYGIGGAARVATRVYGMSLGDGIRPKTLTFDQVDDILSLFAYDPSSFAHLAVKAAPDRLHTLIPGFLIIATLMHELGATSIDICKYGVREGYLIERILGQTLLPQRNKEDMIVHER